MSGYWSSVKKDDESRNGEEMDNPAFVLDKCHDDTAKDDDVTIQSDDFSLQQNDVEANI